MITQQSARMRPYVAWQAFHRSLFRRFLLLVNEVFCTEIFALVVAHITTVVHSQVPITLMLGLPEESWHVNNNKQSTVTLDLLHGHFGHFGSDGGNVFLDDLCETLLNGIGRVACWTDPYICPLDKFYRDLPSILIDCGDRSGRDKFWCHYDNERNSIIQQSQGQDRTAWSICLWLKALAVGRAVSQNEQVEK